MGSIVTTGAVKEREIRGWLRRNLIALVAIGILFPATLVITFATEWNSYNEGRATQAVGVAVGGTGNFGHNKWNVESVQRIYWASRDGVAAGLPSGSDLLVVTTRVVPQEFDDAGASTGCLTRLVEVDGAGIARQWRDSNYSFIDWKPAAGSHTSCQPDITSAYDLETLFVVPHSTSGTLALAIEVVDELPRFLQITLPQ